MAVPFFQSAQWLKATVEGFEFVGGEGPFFFACGFSHFHQQLQGFRAAQLNALF